MLAYHNETNAEVTLATLPIAPEEVSRFGVVEVGRTGEDSGLPGEAGVDQLPFAVQSRRRGRFNGHLHLQHRDTAQGADRRRRGSRTQSTISATTFCPICWARRK